MTPLKSSSRLRVGIMGGAFDPVTEGGHFAAAEVVHQSNWVDEVWWLPSYVHPLGKAPQASFEDRVEMCELQVEDRKASAWLKVKRTEEEVAKEYPGGFTVNTLAYLTQRFPLVAFFLVVGSDNQVQQWVEPDRIFDLVQRSLGKVLVVSREGYPVKQREGIVPLGPTPPLPNVSSTADRQRMKEGDPPAEVNARVYQEVILPKGLYRKR